MANKVAGTIRMVISYMWHKNFVAKYGKGITFKGKNNRAYPDTEYTRYPTREILLDAGGIWDVEVGISDPLFFRATGIATTAHGDVQTKKDR